MSVGRHIISYFISTWGGTATMYRKALAIPAAAIVMLSGAGGAGHWAGSAYAKAKANANQFSGTISVTDYQVPNAMGGGGAATAAANQQLISMTTDLGAL